MGGVGAPRAARLLAAIELGRRAVAGADELRLQFPTSQAVACYLLPLYGGYPVERFGTMLLDSKNRLIKTAILSVGSLDSSIAHPREIYREAAIVSAAGIIVFHNHPSGDPEPSLDDDVLTERLKKVRRGDGHPAARPHHAGPRMLVQFSRGGTL